MHLRCSQLTAWKIGTLCTLALLWAVSDAVRPVILVPGIGGSILDSINQKTNERTRIWLRFSNAEEIVKEQMYVKYNEQTGKAEQLEDYDVVVPEDNFGLYAIDMMNPSIQLPRALVEALYYFRDMREMFEELGYKAGTTLYGFPYDWRQSAGYYVHLERLHDLVIKVNELNQQPIDLVSHSMGGLLVLSYLSKYPDDVALINTWVTLGTPFYGTSRCFNSLLQGENFSYSKIDPWVGHQLLIECPSFYELLPKEGVYKREPYMAYMKKDGYAMCSTIQACVDIVRDANRDNTLETNGRVIKWPFNDALYNLSRTLHERRSKAVVPRRFFTVVGRGLETAWDISYNKPIKDIRELLRQEPVFTTTEGDGTVPIESALGDGNRSKYRYVVDSEHMTLVKHKDVLKAIKHFLGLSCSWAGVWKTGLGEMTLKETYWTVEGTLRDATSDFRLEGTRWHQTLKGWFMLRGTNRSFELTQAPDCKSFDGAWRYEFRVVGEPFELKGQVLRQAQCKDGAVRECTVAHGSGRLECTNGCWCSTCLVDTCDPGYVLQDQFPLGPGVCKPDIDRVATSRWGLKQNQWFSFLTGWTLSGFMVGAVCAACLTAIISWLFFLLRKKLKVSLKKRSLLRVSNEHVELVMLASAERGEVSRSLASCGASGEKNATPTADLDDDDDDDDANSARRWWKKAFNKYFNPVYIWAKRNRLM